MFGTLRVKPCALAPDPRQRYRELYCGTCKALGTHHGAAARMTLSYDVVALAAVVEGLAATPGPVGDCRCPANPTVFRATLEPETAAMRLASAVQVVLADEWLADQAHDVGAPAGWARALLGRQHAIAELTSLGLDPRALEGLSARQAAIEGPGASLDDVVAPTADALGDVMGQVPALVGRGDGAVLGRLGRALGRAIYWIDALEDLGGDARAGRFNPALDADGVPDPDRVTAIADRLHAAVGDAVGAVHALPFLRNRDLLDAALGQVGRRARLATATAHAHADAEASAALTVWRAQPWWWRAADAVSEVARAGWARVLRAVSRLRAARPGQHGPPPERMDEPPPPSQPPPSRRTSACGPLEVCVGCCEVGECCGGCAECGLGADACCCEVGCCECMACDCCCPCG